MAKVTRDATNSGIGPQQKRSMIIDKSKAVTLLFELTQSSVKFQRKSEITQKARVKSISMDTFRDVATSPGWYQDDHSVMLRILHETERCGGDTPIENHSQIALYADSCAERQELAGKTSFSAFETKVTIGGSAFGKRAGDTFESWTASMDNLIQPTIHAGAEERLGFDVSNKLYLQSKFRPKK